MMSTLLYVMHIKQDLSWIMMQGYQLSWFTKLLYYMNSQHLEDVELVQKLIVTLTYGWDHKLIIYTLWIESLLMEADSNKYSQ